MRRGSLTGAQPSCSGLGRLDRGERENSPVATRPVRKSGEENFRRLPDDVAAHLVRPLMCIPAPKDRLALQRADQRARMATISRRRLASAGFNAVQIGLVGHDELPALAVPGDALEREFQRLDPGRGRPPVRLQRGLAAVRG